MEKKKFLKSAFMVLGTAVIVAGATYAVFHDTATVSGNTFSTSDSDLIKIKMPAEGCADWSDGCTGVSWSGLYPGWNRSYNLYLKNVSDAPIIIQTIPVIVETGSNQDLWNNTYMEIVCTGNASTGRYSLSDWKNNAAVEIAPRLRQNEESGLCEVKFDVATSASNEIANVSIGFNLVLNANQVGEGSVAGDETCAPTNDGIEICDSTDNDCDEQVDEGGVCNVSQTEVCDGIDNNDNGEIDDLIPILNPNQVGECLGSTQTCRGSLGWEVDYDNDPDYQIVETRCDSRDNNCDGQTDEGLATPSNCGVGACYRTGSNACVNGQYLNTCVPGVPITEICGNGIDEDCNGSDLACPLDLCVGVNCDDGNICTNDSCLNGSCIHTNNSSGCFNGSCGVMPGTCQSGSCVCTTPPTCTDSASCTDNNPCTDDTCFLGLQCQHSVKTCDDGNAATHDECNPNTGACMNFPYPQFDYSFCLDLPWGGQWCNGQ